MLTLLRDVSMAPGNRCVPYTYFTGKLEMVGQNRPVDSRQNRLIGSHPYPRPVNIQFVFCLTNRVQSFHTPRSQTFASRSVI